MWKWQCTNSVNFTSVKLWYLRFFDTWMVPSKNEEFALPCDGAAPTYLCSLAICDSRIFLLSIIPHTAFCGKWSINIRAHSVIQHKNRFSRCRCDHCSCGDSRGGVHCFCNCRSKKRGCSSNRGADCERCFIGYCVRTFKIWTRTSIFASRLAWAYLLVVIISSWALLKTAVAATFAIKYANIILVRKFSSTLVQARHITWITFTKLAWATNAPGRTGGLIRARINTIRVYLTTLSRTSQIVVTTVVTCCPGFKTVVQTL